MAQDDDNIANPEIAGGKISAGEAGAGVPSPEDLQRRAGELAEIDGLRAADANEAYLDQARRELSGGEATPQDVLPLADELEDREEVPGENGRHIPNMIAGDEANIGEVLVAEGMEEAVHDEMRAGSRKLDRENRGLEADDSADFD